MAAVAPTFIAFTAYITVTAFIAASPPQLSSPSSLGGSLSGLYNFEFMVPLYQAKLGNRLKLLDRFAQKPGVQRPGRRFTLVMASCPNTAVVVYVLSDNKGCVFLVRGWS